MMTDASYDVIVVGTGGVGSAALLHAARRGLRALGLDPRPWAHAQGSSHGQSRIIRMAYFEHPDYVPLLRRAYALWAELEHDVGQRLLHRVGLLQVGPADGRVLTGVQASAERHGLDVQWLAADEVAREFPQLPAPGSLAGVFEPSAGFLLVERCVEAHLELACRQGAQWHRSAVASWDLDGEGVRVQAADGSSYLAGRLILAPGPWAPGLLAYPGAELTVLEKFVHWFPVRDARLHVQAGCPTFLYELPEGVFYGFPQFDPAGVKLAEHTGGIARQSPEASCGERDEGDRTRVEGFAARFAGLGAAGRWSRCYYTMSRDGHFLVGHHPRTPRVVLAAGLSGHGFKFTSVLGEILVDLALDGRTRHPVHFLRVGR